MSFRFFQLLAGLHLALSAATAGRANLPALRVPGDFYELFFPRTTVAAGYIPAWSWNPGTDDLKQPVDVVRYYQRQMSQAVAGVPHIITRDEAPLESIWLHYVSDVQWARAIVNEAAALSNEVLWSTYLGGNSTLRDKVILQRDILQAVDVILAAKKTLLKAGISAAEAQALSECTNWLRAGARNTLLSQAEWTALRHGQGAVELTQGKIDEKWYRFEIPAFTNIHYQVYAGRSFVRTYIKVPGWDSPKVEMLQAMMALKYGRKLNTVISSELVMLPSNTATVLVRTAGVFLKGGDFVDSGVLEELLERTFVVTTPCVDVKTSDLRGTNLRQWKLGRLSADHQGLREVDAEELVFPGFLTDVPSRGNLRGGILTSMRLNCIMCHSEVITGTGSIFSFQTYTGISRDADKEMATSHPMIGDRYTFIFGPDPVASATEKSL